MRRIFFLGILLSMGIFLFFQRAQAQNTTDPSISTPAEGSPLQGLIPIEGTTAIENFISWEITFGYTNDTTGTWFFLAESDEPFSNEILVEWDTATVTDSTYNLRLTVFLTEGRRKHFVVPDLRIRNYTPIETITPTPTLTQTPYTVTPLPSQTSTLTPIPSKTPVPATPTPLPTNPVVITTGDINYSLLRGGAGALAIFMSIGLYSTLRKSLRKR
jgi:hypothetical protein